jgi:hypothetical protein
MFKDNKYTKIYFQIINNALSRINHGYVEKHHIIPKSCGGSNDKNNLVSLTAREHFICHWLLTKMTSGEHLRNMHYAFKIMSVHGKTARLKNIAKNTITSVSDKTKRQISLTMKEQYASGKRKAIKGMEGKSMPASARERISQAQKGKPKTDNHKEKLRQNLKGKTWKLVNGKRMWFNKGDVNV